MKDYKSKLESLFEITTTLKIVDSSQNIIFGSDNYDNNTNPLELKNKTPIDFNGLTSEWETIWKSFGDQWNQERQLFRYFWGECQDFNLSFQLYKQSVEQFLPLVFDKDQSSKEKMLLLGSKGELAIRSIYEYGKQAIDILEKINNTLMSNEEKVFCEKFSGTRNKFLTHYHNASDYPDFIFDPVYWDIMGTGQLLEVKIHLSNKERAYTAYINHYNDYYRLEKILIEVIQKISKLKQAS